MARLRTDSTATVPRPVASPPDVLTDWWVEDHCDPGDNFEVRDGLVWITRTNGRVVSRQDQARRVEGVILRSRRNFCRAWDDWAATVPLDVPLPPRPPTNRPRWRCREEAAHG